MRRLFPFILCAIGALHSLCADCGGSESRHAIQPTLSWGDLSIGLTSLESLVGCVFQTTVTDHFAIVHEAQAEQVLEMGSALEDAYRQFHAAFSMAGFELSRPEGPLVWIWFPQQDAFTEYARRAEGMGLSWLDGYYSMRTNRVAIVQPNRLSSGEATPQGCFDMTRLTHELAHQLAFSSGLQKRGVMYPVWVSEGLATNFEPDELADVDESPSKPARAGCLAMMYTAGEMIPLRHFAVQTRMPDEIITRCRQYAQAWAFFRFLFLERPENLRRYLSAVAERPAGPRDADTLLREFANAFGTPESLEPAWSLFVARQVQSISLPEGMPVARLP